MSNFKKRKKEECITFSCFRITGLSAINGWNMFVSETKKRKPKSLNGRKG